MLFDKQSREKLTEMLKGNIVLSILHLFDKMAKLEKGIEGISTVELSEDAVKATISFLGGCSFETMATRPTLSVLMIDGQDRPLAGPRYWAPIIITLPPGVPIVSSMADTAILDTGKHGKWKLSIATLYPNQPKDGLAIIIIDNAEMRTTG